MKDPYKILGVSKDSSSEDIKKAYRKLVTKTHPDLHPGKKDLEPSGKEISEAYEAIGTEAARKSFHEREAEQNAEAAQTRRGAGPFYKDFQNAGRGGRYSSFYDPEFADVFSSVFEQDRGPIKHRGEDLLFSLEISFEESIRGGTRRIVLPHGKTLDVKIPSGVESGKRLRFPKMGGEGVGGEEPGDVLLEIQVLPSPIFKRLGNDIEMRLPVTVYDATLGGKIEVITPSGPLQVSVPAGSTTGKKLRLRGMGVHHEQQKGDLYLILEIELPQELPLELRDLMEQWKTKHPYVPSRPQ